ncbi:MAG TPA: endonuclease [Rhodobacteraceae bacterium]|nr:endonuclease/exonuclease/phosphatase family protein [Paracoccaceae bacterium]HBG97586.1 endonuclease [Paracoccaceae bacterium]
MSTTSWNIHRGRGQDGAIDAGRTADVLCGEVLAQPTDILVLQEADEEQPPHAGILDLGDVETRTGMRHLHCARAQRWGAESHGFLGVVLFAGRGIEVEALALLDLPGHCHRGAVIAELRKDGCPFRIVGTHLSLSQVLRIVQMRTLGQHLFRRTPRPTVLCGDFNEWRPWGGIAFSRAVLGSRFSGPAPATYPVRRPFLALDRVLAAGGARVSEARVLDGAGIRMASDHRPLRAMIEVAAAP